MRQTYEVLSATGNFSVKELKERILSRRKFLVYSGINSSYNCKQKNPVYLY